MEKEGTDDTYTPHREQSQSLGASTVRHIKQAPLRHADGLGRGVAPELHTINVENILTSFARSSLGHDVDLKNKHFSKL